ncbi:myosin light chain kinase, partial [Caulochytrium protostelioides]
ILGRGTFAVVRLGVDLMTCERLACKIMDEAHLRLPKGMGNTAGDMASGTDQEINILRTVNHPNIIRIRAIIHQKDLLIIIMTKIDGGELFDYIVQRGSLPEHEAKFFFYQLLRAIEYLHTRNISHRDLKPENLLLEKRTPLFVGDFGMAKILNGSLARMQTTCGTVSYLAPEVLDNAVAGYSKNVDLWAAGCILYTMLGGCLPFGNDDRESILRKRMASFTFEYRTFKDVSSEAKDLITALLQPDPDKRPNIEQTMCHPW